MGGVGASSEIAEWLRRLPLRWTFGGLVVAAIWTGLAVLLRGGFHDPIVGGLLAGIGRLLLNIVAPAILLGFVWGLSERRRFEHAIAKGQIAIEKSLSRSVLLNVGKAFVCGVAMALFMYAVVGRYRAFRPWDNAENVGANVMDVIVYGILAIPIGAIVGFLLRRGLSRRLGDAAMS